MEQYFIQHAINNVWGNPDQDNQRFLKGKRITDPFGVINQFTLMNRQVELPVKGKRYHVFQIGQLNPEKLGFSSKDPTWVSEKWLNLADVVEPNQILTVLYTADGTIIPRYQSFMLFSNEKALVFAVEENPKLAMNFKEDAIYFRVYSNAYFNTVQADSLATKIICKGKTVLNTTDILAIQAQITTFRTQPGLVTCFVNGFIVDDITPINVEIGDAVEFIYDGSVKRTVTFNVNSLNIFNSELDSTVKYLLHYPGNGDVTIDYQDDIDIYILAPQAFGRYKGYYYHHNTKESIRMVTHRDYSIVVDYYNYIAQKLADDVSDTPLDLMSFKIMMVVRKSGTNHPLIYDNSRLFELYKLPDDKILQAMVGVNSTLPMWKASSLENNAYAQIMRASKDTDITIKMVQDAYGYNSLSRITGDTPQKTTLVSGSQEANIPQALIGNCTVYEYDANGALLGWHFHNSDNPYVAHSVDCRLIEAFTGKGTNQPDVKFGTDLVPVPTVDNYRVYYCFLVDGKPNNEWRDVTGTDEYTIVDHKVVWANHQVNQFIMVRSDSTYLAYDIELSCVNGNLFFTFAEMEDRGDGVKEYILPVPGGEIDIIGPNGLSLINGLDYQIQFPMVHIVNKKYLTQPGMSATQKFHVRMTGFCSSDLQFAQIDDYGFVQYGYLSNNNRFDIRDDKVLRITLDGKTLSRSDLKFSEEHDGVSVNDPSNGLPYQIKDIIVPLKQLVNEDTYSLRNKALVIDKAVSDYMTIKHPEPNRGDLSIIHGLHQLVSPFLSRILDAMKSNEITEQQIVIAVSDNKVLDLCKPYENILAFDPVNDVLNYDYRFVDVHPHRNSTSVNIPLYQYKFLEKVARLYCHGVVKLSPFFTISN